MIYNIYTFCSKIANAALPKARDKFVRILKYAPVEDSLIF